MWVKICGNTTLGDARMAVELGADAVGFVFALGRRQVEPEVVAGIVEGLSAQVETVGVFPAWDAERIVAAVTVSGVRTIQLHGGPDAGLVRELEGRLPLAGIIEVLHWTGEAGVQVVRRGEGRVLVDSKVGGMLGGTGTAFDWKGARGVFAAGERMILAGGLTPDNVAEAVETLRPWGVDVASGVEGEVGRKDRGRVERFIREARRAGSSA